MERKFITSDIAEEALEFEANAQGITADELFDRIVSADVEQTLVRNYQEKVDKGLLEALKSDSAKLAEVKTMAAAADKVTEVKPVEMVKEEVIK